MSRGTESVLRGDLLALLLLAALALPPRLLSLDADPSLDVFRGVLTDEGAWASNARQAAVFGRWTTDDHNPGLSMAPAYSAALRAVYAVAGVGLAQTRLLSALSGFAACLLVYGLLRRREDVWPAFLAALALGLSYFHLIHNRVALVESWQMGLLLVTAACGLAATRRPLWGVGAGLAFCAALASKHSAAVLLPALVLFWWVEWARSRPFDGRGPLAFAATGAAGIAALGALALAHPDAAADLAGSLRSGLGARGSEFPSVHAVGLSRPALPWSAFLRFSWPLLALAVGFGAARLTRASRVPTGALERLAWCWLAVGLGLLSLLSWAPDRRFLAVMPPLALLAGLAARGGAVALPARDAASPLRLASAGALLGGFVGLVAAVPLREPLRALADALGTGFPEQRVTSLVATAGLVGGPLLAVAMRGWLPARPVALPAAALLLAILAVDGLRIAAELRSPTFGVRDTSRALAALSRDWPEADRVLVGAEAYTYALETRLVAVTVRADRPAGIPQNPDGWERFRPALAMTYDEREEAEARAHGLVPWRSFRPRRVRVAGDERRREIRVFVRPDLCPGGPPPAGASCP